MLVVCAASIFEMLHRLNGTKLLDVFGRSVLPSFKELMHYKWKSTLVDVFQYDYTALPIRRLGRVAKAYCLIFVHINSFLI